VHRGGALSFGKMRNGQVECPYHGWLFNGSGACTLIPSMGKDAKIPARAKIDSYPVQEKYGIVFAFLGDLPEAERPPIMEAPVHGQEGWRCNLIIFDVACNYERHLENGMDPAHNEFVHPTHGLEGDDERYSVPDFEIEESKWGSGFMTRFKGKMREGYETRTAARTDKDGKFHSEISAGTWHHGPNTMLTKIGMTPENWMFQYIYDCPIDEGHIRCFLLNMRNCLLDPDYDTKIKDRCLEVAQQDINIVTKLDPVKTPPKLTREVMVPADSCIVRYREYLNAWTDKGWRIDTRAWRYELSHQEATFTIPSPGRHSEKNWVLQSVPLVPASSEESVPTE
jgi:phenylpropionate dioxygenase-like ring-hydroxylating dioxygenase large terminal subunit